MKSAGGPGERSVPVISAGPTGGMAAAGGAQDAEAATVGNVVFDPHRATIGFIYRIEDAARSSRIDSALRADIQGRLTELIDSQMVAGSGATANVSGFLTSLTNPTAPTAVATFATHAGLAAGLIDGLHAMTEKDVRFLLSEDSVQTLGGLYATNDDSVDLLNKLQMRSGGVRARSLPPAPASNITRGIAAWTGTMMNSCLYAFDGGVMAVTDPYSRAGQGEVRVFIHALFDFQVLRAAAYSVVELSRRAPDRQPHARAGDDARNHPLMAWWPFRRRIEKRSENFVQALLGAGGAALHLAPPRAASQRL